MDAYSIISILDRPTCQLLYNLSQRVAPPCDSSYWRPVRRRSSETSRLRDNPRALQGTTYIHPLSGERTSGFHTFTRERRLHAPWTGSVEGGGDLWIVPKPLDLPQLHSTNTRRDAKMVINPTYLAQRTRSCEYKISWRRAEFTG
jgi:hypothetical protein